MKLFLIIICFLFILSPINLPGNVFSKAKYPIDLEECYPLQKGVDTLVLYISGNCPSCKRVLKALLPKIKNGKLPVTLYIKSFGLKIGELAITVAQKDTSFWGFIDNLLKTSRRLNKKKIITLAEDSKIDIQSFKKNITSKRNIQKTRNNYKEGRQNNVELVPGIFLNNHKYLGEKDTTKIIENLYEKIKSSP